MTRVLFATHFLTLATAHAEPHYTQVMFGRLLPPRVQMRAGCTKFMMVGAIRFNVLLIETLLHTCCLSTVFSSGMGIIPTDSMLQTKRPNQAMERTADRCSLHL